jgi:putative transposase
VSRKVPGGKITTPQAAEGLAGLPLEATVAMADVAGAMREGLLAFSAAAGLVVMQQMLTAELAGIVGVKHAKLGDDRVGNWQGTTTGHALIAPSAHDTSQTSLKSVIPVNITAYA